MRGLLAIAVVIALLVSAAGGYLWLQGTEERGDTGAYANGIWLDVEWVSREHGEAEVARLVHDLADKGFRDLYPFVNSVLASGEPNRATFPYARQFVDRARAARPELRLIAWVGVVNAVRGQGKVPIDEPEVRRNLAAFARELTQDLGFDGVQLNVEPLPNGSQDFLALLDEVRAAIGTEKVLAVAGHKWAPDFVPLVERYSSYWKSAYYREVATRADQIAVMTYDSYVPTADAFRLFQREQTLGVLAAVSGTRARVLVGVPTYYEPRPNHNPEAENVDSALRGVVDALARADPEARARFAGVAVYAHWETDAAEWEVYRTLWQERR